LKRALAWADSHYGGPQVIRVASDRGAIAFRPPVARQCAGSGPGGWAGQLLEPAALGGDQDRLSAVDGAELAVDVVQVCAHRAGRQGQLVRDLLVDLAFGEPLQHAKLAARERTRVNVALALARRARKFVHHAPELARAEPHGA